MLLCLSFLILAFLKNSTAQNSCVNDAVLPCSDYIGPYLAIGQWIKITGAGLSNGFKTWMTRNREDNGGWYQAYFEFKYGYKYVFNRRRGTDGEGWDDEEDVFGDRIPADKSFELIIRAKTDHYEVTISTDGQVFRGTANYRTESYDAYRYVQVDGSISDFTLEFGISDYPIPLYRPLGPGAFDSETKLKITGRRYPGNFVVVVWTPNYAYSQCDFVKLAFEGDSMTGGRYGASRGRHDRLFESGLDQSTEFELDIDQVFQSGTTYWRVRYTEVNGDNRVQKFSKLSRRVTKFCKLYNLYIAGLLDVSDVRYERTQNQNPSDSINRLRSRVGSDQKLAQRLLTKVSNTVASDYDYFASPQERQYIRDSLSMAVQLTEDAEEDGEDGLGVGDYVVGIGGGFFNGMANAIGGLDTNSVRATTSAALVSGLFALAGTAIGLLTMTAEDGMAVRINDEVESLFRSHEAFQIQREIDGALAVIQDVHSTLVAYSSSTHDDDVSCYEEVLVLSKINAEAPLYALGQLKRYIIETARAPDTDQPRMVALVKSFLLLTRYSKLLQTMVWGLLQERQEESFDRLFKLYWDHLDGLENDVLEVFTGTDPSMNVLKEPFYTWYETDNGLSEIEWYARQKGIQFFPGSPFAVYTFNSRIEEVLASRT